MLPCRGRVARGQSPPRSASATLLMKAQLLELAKERDALIGRIGTSIWGQWLPPERKSEPIWQFDKEAVA